MWHVTSAQSEWSVYGGWASLIAGQTHVFTFYFFFFFKMEKIFSGIHSDVLKLFRLGPAPKTNTDQFDDRESSTEFGLIVICCSCETVPHELSYPTGTKPSWYCGFPVFKVASLMPQSIVRYCVSSHSGHILHWYLLFGETQLLSRTLSANAVGYFKKFLPTWLNVQQMINILDGIASPLSSAFLATLQQVYQNGSIVRFGRNPARDQ